MTRSRQSAKDAGRAFETAIAAYLAAHIDERVEVRAKNGRFDRGDITGLVHNGRIVAELKEYGGRLLVSPWLTEAEIERCNDDAATGLVIAKRRGARDPGDQIVLMTVRDLVALITGERPMEDE